MGKFCQFLELSAGDTSIFSCPDDNLSKKDPWAIRSPAQIGHICISAGAMQNSFSIATATRTEV